MKRIQRKRTKGWKMPKGAIYVGRPTMWGNPFRDIGDMVYVDAQHRRLILNPWVYYCIRDENINAASLFRDMLMDPDSHEVEKEIREKFIRIRDHIKELTGKDLACWCKLDQPCHVDVLLESINTC